MALDNWTRLRDRSWAMLIALSITALLTASAAMYLVSLLRLRIKQMVLWKVPGPPAVSFFTGNHTQLHHVGAAKFHEYINKTYGGVIRVTGLLWDTQLIVSDPKACTNILIQDQDVFEETDWFIECNLHTFGPGLLGTLGADHRRQRKQLNPVFSLKHMRDMAPLFNKITRQLHDVFQAKVAAGPQEIDMLNWFSRVALEIIAQGGLGYTFNSLDPDAEESEFGRAIKEYFPTLTSLLAFMTIFPLISRWPSWLLRFGAQLVPLPAVRHIIRIVDVMHRYIKEVFDAKKALLEKGDDMFNQQLSEGNDIISVLMKAHNGASKEDRLPDDEIMGHMTALLFAATDSTSTALSRAVQLLAQRPEMQEKLREELIEAYSLAGETDLDYDSLANLPYLEAVCRETLRAFPPVNFVPRVARADTTIPLSRPIQTKEGPVSSLFVPCGTTVTINVIGANRDPSIWGADAAEWKPERWLAPLPESLTEARIPGVYSNTLTFLGGGRACIGFMFSQLEMKVVLSQLIRAFRFSPSKTEIVWNYGGVTTPSAKGSGVLVPQLPMVVERV
ncbi:cytochrome P450 [Artomyces pyxidatus]|uniref:Cytochrome P450 n=1 Tax=Artomyces pyxidatus TaxID=48021 RepID=A0ACB8SU84_9AGAM|nr:cytochrome P450 [Artomyces pyxidatus]